MAVSHLDFFTAVLKGLGAPVTTNNLTKLAAVARQEGGGGSYNPFNYVVGPGTDFNKVGVKNYADAQTGVAQTIKLLSQRNTGMMRANLMADDSYDNWLNATSNFYRSWGGGAFRISQKNAYDYLGRPVSGGATGSLGGYSAPSYRPVSSQSSLAPITYHNWVTQGWNATNQYKGLSTFLNGLMGYLLQNYGGQNLGGYGRRSIKANQSLPSAHASGAAIDWGYGNDRTAADKVIALITSDPNRWGIQEIHDYSGLRDWRVGRGWKPQARGSHGGDMQPSSHWLHLEVSPERYGSGFDPNAPSGQRVSAMRNLALANSFASIMKPTLSTPSVRSYAPPTPTKPTSSTDLAESLASQPADLRYYSGGKVPTAAESLASMISTSSKPRSVLRG